MTRVDHRQRLQNFFNNTVYYTDQDLNDSIQDGLDEICAFTGAIWKSAVLPFTQYTTYYDLLTLLPDYIGVYAIFNRVIKRFLIPSSLKKFNDSRVDWDTAYGTPIYFAPINHRYVAIYRKPSVTNYGDMVVFYRAAAPTLVDGTAIPLPDEHLTCLESYNIVDLWEQAQEFTKASNYFKAYMEDLDELRILMRNQRNSDRQIALK